MGTLFEITAYGAERQATAQAVEDAFAVIGRADDVMSHYREESDLMRLNRRAAQEAVPVPADLYAVLSEAIKYGELSGGAFDVTVGPLVRLWNRAGETARLPSSEQIREARAQVGFRSVRLLPGTRVRFARTGVEVNLGGIGKGWAVDRAADLLRGRGIRTALINAGASTFYALGHGPDGTGWAVAVRDPCRTESTLATIRLREGSLSTSAGYERYWEIEGERYGHIIDPRSGWPVEPLAGVTVTAPAATESDALSTAVFVLGAEEGEALLRRLGRRGLLIERADGVCRAHEVGKFTSILSAERE